MAIFHSRYETYLNFQEESKGDKGVQVCGSHFLCSSNVFNLMAHLFIVKPCSGFGTKEDLGRLPHASLMPFSQYAIRGP